ncbi:hypothetical protein [Aliivibrio sp. EL58]|uniref:hypothetical protein n=1 Tax=Aliivibrio sp. EL58 TaxID=2107582 RepID=UPI000EFCF636|nr:hypothetical protein [Aliivibrio sp. EL58]
MNLDVDIIKLRADGDYRLSKVRGECMISVRIPGGIMPAYLLSTAQEIAEKWGNGIIHLTTRQKLAMPGIRYEDIPAVNKALKPFIKDITQDICGVEVEDLEAGYQSIGGRTSKKTPRVGKQFLNWVTEEVIHDVIENLFEFEKDMLKGTPKYLHMGHLIDKGGYMKFKERVLRGVTLNSEAKVAERMYWAEDEYVANMYVK